MLEDIIPAKVRKYVYALLGLLTLIELAFDFIDPDTERKLMIVVAGAFGMAWANTNTTTQPDGDQ